MKYEKLFSPYQLGPVKLRNHLFQSVGQIALGSDDRGYTQRYIDYYAERAKNGVGLFITGHVKMESKIDPYPVFFPSLDTDYKWFCELTETVHAYGAKIAVQLNPGTGRLADVSTNGKIPGSSCAQPTLYDPNVYTYEMSVDEIHERARLYGKAAAKAKAAGFDFIVVNTQAYLFDQYLTPAWNKRTDEYGGSLENRLRFVLEAIDEVRKNVGPNYPLLASISMDQGIEGGKTLEDWIGIAQAFEKKGILALHMRNGSYDVGEWKIKGALTASYMSGTCTSLENVRKVRPYVNIPIISDGSFLNPANCEAALEEGVLQMVGVDRPLIADPEWAVKARTGREDEIRPCLRCMECMDRFVAGKFLGCAVNPLVGHEAEAYKYRPTTPKRVLVVGGGHSGILTSIYASKRGHKVTLCEKTDTLGGLMLPASASPYKRQYQLYIDWLKRELDKSEVEVRMGVDVDKKYVDEFKPDAVVICCGSKPIHLKVPGADGENVKIATDVLMDAAGVGENVAVIGSGMVGAECAIDLAMQGKHVKMIEMQSAIGNEIMAQMRRTLVEKMKELGVEMLPGTRTTEITGEGIKAVNVEGAEEFIPVDTVVTAVGLRSQSDLYYELLDSYEKVYMVGDCQQVRRFIDSNREAYAIANIL